MDPRYYATVLAHAREHGFRGFGGYCGKAAIAINRVLFDSKGKLVGALNKAFLVHGRAIGHVAVRYQGAFWDSDGKRKTIDEVESWGMLDASDSDYIEGAEALGFALDDTAADDVEIVMFDNEAEVMQHFDDGDLAHMERVLQAAKARV